MSANLQMLKTEKSAQKAVKKKKKSTKAYHLIRHIFHILWVYPIIRINGFTTFRKSFYILPTILS